MIIKSAKFVRGITKEEDMLDDGIPQILFIGRSNVGKSSVINSFTRTKELAISSSTPGRTRQVNVFLINKQFYLIDLPGYGFARGSEDDRARITDLISWYIFFEHQEMRRVVVIIDIVVGLMESDLHIIKLLEEDKAEFIILANKCDKLKANELKNNLEKVKKQVGTHTIIPYSAKKNKGLTELTSAALHGLKKISKDDLVVPLEMDRYPERVLEDEFLVEPDSKI